MAVKYPTEVLNEAREGSTSIGISADWAYDKEIADALELERLKGISLDLPYLYAHNTKTIATCEADEGWESEGWAGSADATASNDTINYKVGEQGIKIEDSVNGYIRLQKEMDLSKFEDGSSSSDDDYIQFMVYVPDDSLITSSVIYFPCDTVGTYDNLFQIVISSLISTGWNRLKLAKSSATAIGSADWANVKGINLRISPTALASYTIDAVQLVRKDPSSAIPNPLQIENDGVMERLFEIISGTVYLGYDNAQLVLKGMENSSLDTVLTFSEFYVKINSIATDDTTLELYHGTTDTDRHRYTLADTTIIYDFNDTTSVTGSLTLAPGDEVETVIKELGTTSYMANTLSDEKDYLSKITQVSETDKEVRLYVAEDASIVSFNISSSPQILGGS